MKFDMTMPIFSQVHEVLAKITRNAKIKSEKDFEESENNISKR